MNRLIPRACKRSIRTMIRQPGIRQSGRVWVWDDLNRQKLSPAPFVNRRSSSMPLLDPLSSITTALKRDQIIPDVIPTTFSPSTLLSITWSNGKEALLGNELTREDTMDEPSISFSPIAVADSATGELLSGSAIADVTYTLVMSDPDAPSRADPKYGEFRHWVITSLKLPLESASSFTALKTKNSTTPYRPPGPPPGSGVHRYVFLLFQEPLSTPLSIPSGAPEYGEALEERRSWNAVKFGEKYGLKLVGANFFTEGRISTQYE